MLFRVMASHSEPEALKVLSLLEGFVFRFQGLRSAGLEEEAEKHPRWRKQTYTACPVCACRHPTFCS